MKISEVVIILAHAFLGWVLCAATMGIGMAVTSLDNTLVIHAIGAPIFFAIVSLIYFRTCDRHFRQALCVNSID